MTSRSSATLLLALVIALGVLFAALTIADASTSFHGARGLLF